MRQTRGKIEHELLQRIHAGIYPLGARLPSRRALLHELGGSPLTLQAAFDQLTAQGFIVAHGSRGSFVAGCLPGQSTIALVFNDELERGAWNRFWSAIHRVASDWSGPSGLEAGQFRSYCLAGGKLNGPVYQQLCSDLGDGALAGVVFTSPPPFINQSALFTAPVPRLCIAQAALGSYSFAASQVHCPDTAVLTSLCQRFRSAGRQRIAGLAGNALALERVRTLTAAQGLEARPEWWHWLPTDAFGALPARRLLHLLGTLPARQRPDCLLILDDNLVPAATNGVLDAQWQGELEIAAHANFPRLTHAAVPCLRYGLDAAHLLQAVIDEVARLANGGAPRLVEVPFTVAATAR